MEQLEKRQIKSKISNIIIDGLNHVSPDYRTGGGFVRWGKVEEDIHTVLGDNKDAKESFSRMLLEAVNGQSNRYRLSNGHLNWEALQKDALNIIDNI